MTGIETLDLLLDRASADRDEKTVRVLRTIKDAFISEVNPDTARLDWLTANAKVVWWPKDGSYPIEYNPMAKKQGFAGLPLRAAIDASF